MWRAVQGPEKAHPALCGYWLLADAEKEGKMGLAGAPGTLFRGAPLRRRSLARPASIVS